MKYKSSFYKKIKDFDVSVIESDKYYNKTEVLKLFDTTLRSISRYFSWQPSEKNKHIKHIFGSELIRFINQYKEKELSSEDIAKHREQISNTDYVSKALDALSNDLSKGFV